MQRNQVIARVSKGSNMNQIYLPKNAGVRIMPGDYVVINLLTSSISEKQAFKPYFYGIKELEPIKLKIVEEVFDIILKLSKEEVNIIITGSFLDKGFNFNDLDILILDNKIDVTSIEKKIYEMTGIRTHIIALTKEELTQGLASDPLFQTMISRCISKDRLIFNYKPIINVKILDLHLLKSKNLIDNFEVLSGREKYYLTFNLLSIMLFLEKGKITKEIVEKVINQEFHLKNNEEIKENLIREEFLNKYKKLYDKTFNLIMKNSKGDKPIR